MRLDTFITLLTLCRTAFGSTKHTLRGMTSGCQHNITYVSAAYYTNWATYDRNFDPQDLPTASLTHVLYAFANLSSSGQVLLSDPWADTEKHFAGDDWDNTGTKLYGCFKQLYLLKKVNRHLKVLLSIGGATFSANFARPASSESGRLTFAKTAVALVADLGLDGLDIDWEFPQDGVEAANMVLLLQSIRAALDAYGNSLNTPYHFQLTVACPAGPVHYQKLHIATMDAYVDFWFMMAYSYAGSWSDQTGHHANLFSSSCNPASTPFDTAAAIDFYVSKGVSSQKIVLGMPLYGQSFAATGGLGQAFNGVGLGTWETGIYDFKSLPLVGATEFYDSATGSSYSYDNSSKELVSYDSIPVVKQKATFIKQMRLGGAMWWESSADRSGNQSLIQHVATILAGVNGSCLMCSQNHLAYPNSTYENLRVGMLDSNSVHTRSQMHEASLAATPRPESVTTSLARFSTTLTNCSESFVNPQESNPTLLNNTVPLSSSTGSMNATTIAQPSSLLETPLSSNVALSTTFLTTTLSIDPVTVVDLVIVTCSTSDDTLIKCNPRTTSRIAADQV